MEKRTGIAKYVALADRLRRDVATGVLKPGERVPSFPQLRVQYGISQNTVEKAHALLEQEGLIVRHQGRGTFVAQPNERRTQTGIIGFSCNADRIAGGVRSAYWTSLVEGVEEAAHRAGLEILLLHRQSEIRWEKVDGVIVSEHDFRLTIDRLPPGMPCVSLLVDTQDVPSVIPDDRQGIRDLTRYLTNLGHRRIAYLMSTYDFEPSLRLPGYHDALKEAGIAFDERLTRSMVIEEPRQGFRKRGQLNMQAWLEDNWQELAPTALMVHNDDAALGVLDALEAAGIKVPDHLSVAGFDGLTSLEAVRAHLTTVRVPLHEIGERGVELLIQQINCVATEREIVMPVAVQEGLTTKAIA